MPIALWLSLPPSTGSPARSPLHDWSAVSEVIRAIMLKGSPYLLHGLWNCAPLHDRSAVSAHGCCAGCVHRCPPGTAPDVGRRAERRRSADYSQLGEAVTPSDFLPRAPSHFMYAASACSSGSCERKPSAGRWRQVELLISSALGKKGTVSEQESLPFLGASQAGGPLRWIGLRSVRSVPARSLSCRPPP